jgi:SOS-response transcriptional repressor LexA
MFPSMSEPEKTILQTRLAELLDKRKQKAAPLSRQLGLGESFVRDLLRGKTRSPRAEGLAKLAEALGTTTAYLLGDDVDGELDGAGELRHGAPLQYAGVVQAGAFLAVDDYFNQDPEIVPDFVLPDTSLPRRVRQYAWRAKGDSMNEAGILDGMWIVAADATDYIDTVQDVETGDLVVVERTRHQGAEREVTVKEVHFFRNRYELRPVSSNSDHVPIVVENDRETNENGTEVKIIGVVLTAYANLRRRK